jgi:hypothetical protein
MTFVLAVMFAGSSGGSGWGMVPVPCATADDCPVKAPPAGFGSPLCSYRDDRGRPDLGCTPGATLVHQTTKRICRPGYGQGGDQINPQTEGLVYSDYNVLDASTPGAYQIDHLIPVQLGGSNAETNLWPQPRTNARGFGYPQKNHLERVLRRLVCEHRLSLRVAQHQLATDWISAARRYADRDPTVGNTG